MSEWMLGFIDGYLLASVTVVVGNWGLAIYRHRLGRE
jgi:hypothetical protein